VKGHFGTPQGASARSGTYTTFASDYCGEVVAFPAVLCDESTVLKRYRFELKINRAVKSPVSSAFYLQLHNFNVIML
jgi:hypothetical protein